jgi:hypothetical protein
MDEAWTRKIQEVERIANDAGAERATLEELVERLEVARGFFTGFPWIPVTPN